MLNNMRLLFSSTRHLRTIYHTNMQTAYAAVMAGISKPVKLEMQEVKNKRTGEIERVPKDITPSFAHNHSAQLEVLEKLFKSRHGQEKFEKMQLNRAVYLVAKGIAPPEINLVTLPKRKYPKKEIARLMAGGANNTAEHEALAAAGWQEVFGVKLVTYSGESKNPADFWIVDNNKPQAEWQTLDFMFTMDADKPYHILNMNKNITKTSRKVLMLKENLINHAEKSDIVPLDMRYLNDKNRTLIINFLLTLPLEKRNQFYLLVEESL